MARRKKRQSIVENVLNDSWGLSATFAILTFLASYIALPSIDNPFIKPMIPQFQVIGLGATLLFSIIAAIKFIINHKKIRSVQGAPSTPLPISPNIPLTNTPQNHLNTWSLQLIRTIEWKNFEILCTAYYLEKGIQAEATSLGADGGIDIKLYQNKSKTPTAIVQCKSWFNKVVGVKEMREFLGVMSHEKIPKGFYITTNEFTPDAKAFAHANNITLITGELLLMMILRLPDNSQKKLLALATNGDYTTPSCPSCGTKMIKRISTKGSFWGCSNYPQCHQKLYLRKA